MAGLLLVVAMQELSASHRLSATFDEQAHMAAGYAYATAADYRFNPEHPPLLKLLAGVAMRTLPMTDVVESAAFRDGDQWQLGARILTDPAIPPWAALDRARIPSGIVGLLGAWLTYRLAATLHGHAAGFLGLLLYAGWPEIVGHAILVTTDVPVMTFGLGAVLGALRLRRGFTWRRAGAFALHLALAMMVKFSGPVLLLLLTGLLVAPGGRLTPRHVVATGTVALLAIVAVGLLAYQGPRFFAEYPVGFWMALTRSKANPDYEFYLLGRYARSGFWSYFPVALLLKTPLPLIMLAAWGCASLVVRRPDRREILGSIVPAVAWLLVTAAFAANIGLRYLLPAFPFFVAIASRVVRAGPVATVAATGLGFASCLVTAVTPDAVGYTNALVRKGQELRYLDMSNVDWGQGLRALDRSLSAEGVTPTLLLYSSPFDATGLFRDGRVRQVAGPGSAWDPATGVVIPGRYAVSAQRLLREPGLRERLAAGCGVEAPLGPSLYLFCCPPCREPALPEDDVLRIPLAPPPPPP